MGAEHAKSGTAWAAAAGILSQVAQRQLLCPLADALPLPLCPLALAPAGGTAGPVLLPGSPMGAKGGVVMTGPADEVALLGAAAGGGGSAAAAAGCGKCCCGAMGALGASARGSWLTWAAIKGLEPAPAGGGQAARLSAAHQGPSTHMPPLPAPVPSRQLRAMWGPRRQHAPLSSTAPPAGSSRRTPPAAASCGCTREAALEKHAGAHGAHTLPRYVTLWR